MTSVSPDAKSQFETFQATNVLGGQELTDLGTLGTAENQPARAPEPVRGPAPVVRPDHGIGRNLPGGRDPSPANWRSQRECNWAPAPHEAPEAGDLLTG